MARTTSPSTPRCSARSASPEQHDHRSGVRGGVALWWLAGSWLGSHQKLFRPCSGSGTGSSRPLCAHRRGHRHPNRVVQACSDHDGVGLVVKPTAADPKREHVDCHLQDAPAHLSASRSVLRRCPRSARAAHDHSDGKRPGRQCEYAIRSVRCRQWSPFRGVSCPKLVRYPSVLFRSCPSRTILGSGRSVRWDNQHATSPHTVAVAGTDVATRNCDVTSTSSCCPQTRRCRLTDAAMPCR
jgi:hypothetical protein